MAIPKKINKRRLRKVQRNLKRINTSRRSKRRQYLERKITQGGTCCSGSNTVKCPPGYICNAECKCIPDNRRGRR
tara:strand:+ start:255 stop:479 length:225 start_codon:yes stop_codon:yes gene_type:complete